MAYYHPSASSNAGPGTQSPDTYTNCDGISSDCGYQREAMPYDEAELGGLQPSKPAFFHKSTTHWQKSLAMNQYFMAPLAAPLLPVMPHHVENPSQVADAFISEYSGAPQIGSNHSMWQRHMISQMSFDSTAGGASPLGGLNYHTGRSDLYQHRMGAELYPYINWHSKHVEAPISSWLQPPYMSNHTNATIPLTTYGHNNEANNFFGGDSTASGITNTRSSTDETQISESPEVSTVDRSINIECLERQWDKELGSLNHRLHDSVMPQRMYRSRSTTDHTRYVKKAKLQPPVLFTENPESNTPGVSLRNILQSPNPRALIFDSDSTVMFYDATLTSIRLQVPGYSPKKQIERIYLRKGKGSGLPIDKGDLGVAVSHAIEKILDRLASEEQDLEVVADQLFPWTIGSNEDDNISAADLRLLSIRHVSQGSWQPILCLDPSSVVYQASLQAANQE